MKVMVLFAICLVAYAGALPNLPRHRKGGTGKLSKGNENDDNQRKLPFQSNLPLAFSDYYSYDYFNYDYYDRYMDCDGEICVEKKKYFDIEEAVDLDNSSLKITEERWLNMNLSTLWAECAPSVPLEGRLARFKSCNKWTEDYENIFNNWYINDVCNYRNRMWLTQNGDIDTAKIQDMYSQLDGFKEYLDSCIEWDGERPDYYDEYYDYGDYQDEKGIKKYGAKDKTKKFKSKNKKPKNKTNKNSGNKKRKGDKHTKRNKKNANKRNKKNKSKVKKRNKNKAKKRNKHKGKKRNKGRRNQSKKANKNSNQNGNKVNGMRYRRDAKKKQNGNKNEKKKKKKKKQKKALKLIDLTTLPTKLTMERLDCISLSISIKLEQCGENILKKALP